MSDKSGHGIRAEFEVLAQRRQPLARRRGKGELSLPRSESWRFGEKVVVRSLTPNAGAPTSQRTGLCCCTERLDE